MCIRDSLIYPSNVDIEESLKEGESSNKWLPSISSTRLHHYLPQSRRASRPRNPRIFRSVSPSCRENQKTPDNGCHGSSCRCYRIPAWSCLSEKDGDHLDEKYHRHCLCHPCRSRPDHNLHNLSPDHRSWIIYRLSLIHIWRCRRLLTCRSRWSPYH